MSDVPMPRAPASISLRTTSRINCLLRGCLSEVAYARYAITADRDIRDVAFPAGAIVDGPAFDDDIERRISRSDLSAADDNSKKERTNPGAHSELSHR